MITEEEGVERMGEPAVVNYYEEYYVLDSRTAADTISQLLQQRASNLGTHNSNQIVVRRQGL